MTARFRRASITPFDDAGRNTLDDQAVPFDFNPETLTLKTSAGQSRDRARQGRQQVQNVGASTATLSFEAVFDSTRPRDGEDGRTPLDEEELDVRLRTRPLALLIQAAESRQGGSGGGGGGRNRQPAPKRVQFRWGSIVFNGLITQYQETFDYFSPGGVPLRSKVQITLTEQEFRYEIDSSERARAQSAAPPAPGGLRDAAGAAGADSLFD
ncbi:CIS tube protein, partial [Falsiroseomonas oryzae]|uniref:CIS tube protein n=1 Tax=Falsiroseomonas oryzae TaxID=2766473 RepID=UPI0038CC0E99